jgi:NADH:ubiquinone oxidoreductase subunit F (NADH-binding)/NADH:ubiquinone oxidoreductase subunit E
LLKYHRNPMTNKKIVYRPIAPDVVEIVNDFNNNPEAVLDVFTELQKRNGWIKPQQIEDVARALRIPAGKAYGIATFYTMLTVKPSPKNVVRLCDGPVCWLCGGETVLQDLEGQFTNHMNWKVERSSCLGMCDRSPAALVNDKLEGPIALEKTNEVENIWQGRPVDYSRPRVGELRVMLRNMGEIDPDSLESAQQYGAYQGLQDVLERPPMDVIAEVEASGLTGRGGAGFPVGRKWRFVAQANRSPKFIICNADESEPLIFKDRVLMDANPHQILEGMAIAGYACGANEGYIYIRGEYFAQAARLKKAINQAEQEGLLGKNIMGKGYNFQVHVHRGAGAYICGEETALIESLEGKRGEPRTRPPYPPTAGYDNLPTLVNNVESYAAIPAILKNGAEWYRSLSSAVTPGTKLYMLLGHVNQPGLFEAPFGLTLRQVIDEYGGGMRLGSTFYFALTGGAAGTIVSADFMDIPIDYSSASQGISLGAGAFLVCDQRVSPVKILHNLLNFFRLESCGKCTPCRVGTHRTYEILDQMIKGKGQPGDNVELRKLADLMYDSSFCGLGQSVPIPIRTALNNFPLEFVVDQRHVSLGE